MRALGALIFVVIVTAVTLATPIPVLAVTDGVTSVALWLDDGERYRYTYPSPLTGATVEERHLRSNDRLRVTSASSPDRAALAQLGWEGEPRRAGDAWEQSAPRNEKRRLAIAVSRGSGQRLSGDRWTLDLGTAFTESLVQLTAERLPVVSALLRGWRP